MSAMTQDKPEQNQDAQDRAILLLWKSRTQDTVDIAKHLGLTEAEVANRLLHLRGQRRS